MISLLIRPTNLNIILDHVKLSGSLIVSLENCFILVSYIGNDFDLRYARDRGIRNV